MDQQVGFSFCSFLPVCCYFLFYVYIVFFSLDGEDSDLSRGASRMCSPIQSEEEMVIEDLETASDHSKLCFVFFFSFLY